MNHKPKQVTESGNMRGGCNSGRTTVDGTDSGLSRTCDHWTGGGSPETQKVVLRETLQGNLLEVEDILMIANLRMKVDSVVRLRWRERWLGVRWVRDGKAKALDNHPHL